MNMTKGALALALLASITACGGGGSADSEVVTVEPPVTDNGDSGGDGGTPDVAEPIAAEDITSTEDLTVAADVELKPSKDINFEVDLSSGYDGATVVLCIADAAVTTAASINFNNCIYSGRLDGGQLNTSLTITNTVEFLAGAVISGSEADLLRNWQNVNAGETLRING